MTLAQAAHEYGRQKALLFQAFAYFAHRQARDLNLDTLYFITREGAFFKAVHESLFREPWKGEAPIDTVLLEASRQSTFGPSVATGSELDLSRLWNLYPRITPRAFLKSLNLDEEEFARFFELKGLPLDHLVSAPWKDENFQKVLGDEAFRQRMKNCLENDSEITQSYFSPRFEGKEKIGLVEIGWQGSIQDGLALIYPNKHFYGFYLGLAIAKNPALPNSSKFAFGPDRNRSRHHKELLNAVNLLEFMCLSPGGSTSGYRLQTPEVAVAERTRSAAEDALIEQFSIPFQRGVISQSSPSQLVKLQELDDSGGLRKSALRQWANILEQPQPDLVQAYFALKSNEEFGMGEFRDQAATPSWMTIGISPFSAHARESLIRYLTYSQWAKGLRSRQDISVSKRWVLYFLMRTALIAKTWTHAHKAKKSR